MFRVHCAPSGAAGAKCPKLQEAPADPTHPRLKVRSALLGLFVALTVVLASTTVYESGIRTTLTSTSTSTNTSTSTLTQTTTVTTSPPISSTTRLTTSTLFSSGSTAAFGVGNSSALVLNSSDGLGLSLQVEPSLNGNYTITFTVRESNFLNSVDNVTKADKWGYPKGSLNPANPCGVDAPTPVGLALVQGRYSQDNYTSAKALTLYDTNGTFGCTTITFTASSYEYAFQPLSDAFSFPSSSTLPDHGAASVSITTSGYWTGGQDNVAAAFKPFSAGYYTVIGADEWGNVVLLQIYVP